MKNIAIIGAGITGIATAKALVQQAISAREPIALTLFEQSGQFGGGLPYSASVPHRYKLNHAADDMGPGFNILGTQSKHGDFYDWIQKNEDELSPKYPDYDLTNPKSFLPRALYGEYINDSYNKLKQYAKIRGISIIEKPVGVDDIDIVNGKPVLSYEEKSNTVTQKFDRAVLAVGHWYDKDHVKQQQNPKYLTSGDVYKMDTLPEKEKHVAVRGTGLTATELALKMLDDGHRVTMFSRHGSLSAVRPRKYEPKDLEVFTADNIEKIKGPNGVELDDAMALFKEEIENIRSAPVNWKDVYASQSPKDSLVRQIADHHAEESHGWSNVLKAAGAQIQKTYEHLSPESKARFVKEHKSTLVRYRAPMSVGAAERLLGYMNAGRLSVVGGSLSVSFDKVKNTFEIQTAATKNGRPVVVIDEKESMPEGAVVSKIEADYLVNATGQSAKLSQQPLLKKMVDRGILQQSPQGGVMVDTSTLNPLDAAGKKQDELFVIGPSLMGEMLISSNVTINSKRAELVAEQMLPEQKRSVDFVEKARNVANKQQYRG